MKDERMCLVGRDEDSGFLWSIIIFVVVVSIILTLITFGGAFIGGFHALKNYGISFKHNIIDSNKKLAA